MSDLKLLLNAKEAAAALGISERLLWSMSTPRGPITAVKIGRSVRYPVDALRTFIESRTGGRS
jgi:predicted DNA-binding transcriptional regulator AlpA